MHGFTGYRILRRSEKQPKHLLINIILSDIAWEGMDAFLGVNVDGFESNENTKSEMFTDITESLSLFSDEKKRFGTDTFYAT